MLVLITLVDWVMNQRPEGLICAIGNRMWCRSRERREIARRLERKRIEGRAGCQRQTSGLPFRHHGAGM